MGSPRGPRPCMMKSMGVWGRRGWPLAARSKPTARTKRGARGGLGEAMAKAAKPPAEGRRP
eukprot:9066387-Alexandrium_andersonii.AAC.1